MNDAPLELAQIVAQDGPAWVAVLAIIGILIWVIYKYMNIYEKTNERKISSQETMNQISGQMAQQMERSNAVLEAVEKQLSLTNAVNDKLVDSLTKSQNRSASMAESVKTMADRIEHIYERTVLEH